MELQLEPAVGYHLSDKQFLCLLWQHEVSWDSAWSELGQCPWLLTGGTFRDSQSSLGLQEHSGSPGLLKGSLHQ